MRTTVRRGAPAAEDGGPLTNNYSNGEDASFFSTVRSLATRLVSRKEVNTYKGIWRHPAKGTGQICEKLAECPTIFCRLAFPGNPWAAMRVSCRPRL
jgi:hypothetical protein